MRIYKNNQKGFSLIELLVALAIFAIVMPSFFSFIINTIFNVKKDLDFTNGVLLAERKMEYLVEKSYDDSDLTDRITTNNSNLDVAINVNSLLNDFNNYVNQNFDHNDPPQSINNLTYYVFWNIAEDSTITSLVNYKKIGVIVYWYSRGQGHKIYLESFKREE